MTNQPTTNKRTTFNQLCQWREHPSEKIGSEFPDDLLFLHTILRSHNLKGRNCVSALRGAKAKQTLRGRRAKAGTTEKRSLLAAGRTRNYQIWIKMTLGEREKNLLLRWSRLIISSAEWWRGRESAEGTGGTITWGPEELTRAVISISNGKARGDQTHFTVMIRSLSLNTEPHKCSG